MFRILCLLIGYSIGCIQTAFIVGKLMGKIDIRDYGSGNAGTTNATRVLGAKAGIIVFLSDVLKGILGYCLCSLIFKGGGTFFSEESLLPGIYGGLGVILGHDFPFYLKFRGGKGIASTLGFMLCINPWIALITYILGIIIVSISKIISVSSLAMVLIFPIVMIFFKLEREAILIMLFITVLSYYQHKSNIKRLFKGEEDKVNLRKTK